MRRWPAVVWEHTQHLLVGLILLAVVVGVIAVLVGGIVGTVLLADSGHYVWAVLCATPLVLCLCYAVGRSTE